MTCHIFFYGRHHKRLPPSSESVSRTTDEMLRNQRVTTTLAPADWLKEQDKNYAAYREGYFVGEVFEVVAIYSWLPDTSDATRGEK